MNYRTLKLLKDIQSRAEQISYSHSGESELVEFEKYNKEIKTYFLNNIKDNDLLILINEIPDIFETEMNLDNKLEFGILSLSILTLGISYIWLYNYRNKKKIDLILQNINIARGKYASIEFLVKAKM